MVFRKGSEEQIEVVIPGDIAVLRVRGEVLTGNEAFVKLVAGHADLEDKIGRLPEGLWPVFSDGRTILVHCLDHESERLMIARETPDLDRYLSRMAGSGPMLLIDSAGTILAATYPFKESIIRSGDPGSRDISSVISSSSLSTFWSAISECRNLEKVHPFNVEALSEDGRVTLVASLRLLPGGLFTVNLSPPTLDLAGFCPEETSIVETIVNCVPVPAILINSDGIVTSANELACNLALVHEGGSPLGTRYWEWITEREREGLIAAHHQRLSGGSAPFRFQVRASVSNGIEVPLEVTSLLMPNAEETLVFFVSAEGYGSFGAPAGAAGVLSHILEETRARDQADLMRTALEFLKIGTEAAGVSIFAGGRLHASGEVPLDTGSLAETPPGKEAGSETWTRTIENLYNFHTSIRLRSGVARLALYGLRSNSLSGFPRLALSLGPLLVDYAETVSSQKTIMDTVSTILDTWDFLRMGDSGPEKFLARAADVTGADAIVIWGSPGPDGALQPVVSSGLSSDPEPLNLSAETSPGWSYTHSEPVYVADSTSDGRFSPTLPGYRSEVVVPLLRRQGRATGVMLAASRQPGAFPNPAPSLVRLLSIPLSLWLFPEGRASLDSPARDALEQQDRTDLEDVLLSLGHRLRAPGAAMRGFCDLLASGRLGELNPDQREAIDSLSRSAMQMFEQVERLLSFLRLEIQPERVEGSWGRPSEILEAVLHGIEPRLKEAGLQTAVEVPAASFTAFFDRQRLEEVIWNLVDNAIRFSRPGGVITVRMRAEKASWVLEVEDSGAGIPSRSLPYIFDRFYRSGDETTAGLGIGLSIVRRFTEMMGGTVNVFSREGKGSRFNLRFPVPGGQE